MLQPHEFEWLYNLLSIDMVGEDCGIKCGQFCCVDKQGGELVRYLLPGERIYLEQQGFFSFVELDTTFAILPQEDFLYYYKAQTLNSCACEQVRNYRPFVCRMFPFRPVFDKETNKIVEIEKVTNPFFAPCWITEPLPTWRSKAIKAWNYLLSDLDNLIFFARYYYLLKLSLHSPGLKVSELEQQGDFQEQLHTITRMPRKELWQQCTNFFQLLATTEYI